MEFYQRLNSLMEEFGYTNYRVAKLLDCHQSAVANWVSGKNIPQKHTIAKLADLFSVSVEYLKGETDDRGETKKAPATKDERKEDVVTQHMQSSTKLAILIEMFNQLPEDAQNDIIYQLLVKVRDRSAPDAQK